MNPCDYFFGNACVTNIRPNKFANRNEFIEEIKRGVEGVQLEHIKNAVYCFKKIVRDVEESKCAWGSRYWGNRFTIF